MKRATCAISFLIFYLPLIQSLSKPSTLVHPNIEKNCTIHLQAVTSLYLPRFMRLTCLYCAGGLEYQPHNRYYGAMSTTSKDGSSHVTDETFNTASHMVGAIFALLGGVILVVNAALADKLWHLIAFSIYGLSLFLLFLASSLHHGVNAGARSEHVLRQFDYLAIFPLIAGTYTPMCLIVLRGPLGWSVFGVIWLLAAFGIAIKASISDLPKWFTSTLYLAMGLMSLILVVPLFRALSLPAILLLILGGVFYVGGNVIFSAERPNPVPGKFGFHEIWHVCVLAGALSHYLMMYLYIQPL